MDVMSLKIKSEKAVLASLLLLFVCRGVLATAIVPPWQGPDEPVHFLLAQLLTMPDDSLNPVRPKLELQVLDSMERYRWWELRDGRTPRSSSEATTDLGIGLYSQPLYYGLGAAVLRVVPPASLDGAYWRLRILSIALSVATLVVAWAGTQLLFGAAVAIGATAIAALHPQFLLTAISVSSDALAILLGACMWWLVARVVTGHRSAMSRTLLVVTAAATLLTKRNAVPVTVVAGIIAMGSFLAQARSWPASRTMAMTGILLTVTAAILTVAWVAFGGPFTELAVFWRNSLAITRGEVTLPLMVEHVRISIDSTWLVAGWLGFPAPEPWLWVARVLTVAGLAGAAILLFRSPALRRPLSIAWVFVIAQAAAVVGLGFLTNSYPQGRYLFPVMAPATALLWLGLTQAVPACFRRYAAPILISILAVMDVTGFTAVLIPAYLPWG